MLRTSRTRFSSLELAKVFIEEGNLSKLSAFFRFCLGYFASRRIFAHKASKTRQTFFGYSIVKYHKNAKGAVTFKFSLEKLALPLPLTISDSTIR